MQKTRDSFPDILRGFALLGIAVVNIQYFALDTSLGFEAGAATPGNTAASLISALLFQSKFFILFSFLFGYSASYVVQGSRSNLPRWVGRSIGLILLGVAHLLLLFHGDILFIYGLFALALVPFLFKSSESLQRLAKRIIYVFGFALFALSILAMLGEQFSGTETPAAELGEASPNALNAALASEGFLDALAPRFEQWIDYIFLAVFIQGPIIFAAFLLGVAVAKKQGLGSGASRSVMLRLTKWGFGLGLPLQLASALLFLIVWQSDPRPIGLELMALSLNYVTAPLLSVGYLGALWLVSQRLSHLSLLAAAGRHSLTIYLGQSVVFAYLFSRWGAGLFGELQPPALIATAIVTWLGLSLLALLNLRLTGRGPLELLLTNFSKLFQRNAG
ncbi:MAG: DUF418 domain-containing protein [Aquiluna sp.]